MSNNIPAFSYPQKLQFEDGVTALSYSSTGNRIILGADSNHRYARDFTTVNGNEAIIKTNSGNSYLIKDGVILNSNTGATIKFELQDSFSLTVGESAKLMNQRFDAGWITSPVTSVILRAGYEKSGSIGYTQIGECNPFDVLSANSLKQENYSLVRIVGTLN